ncbi:[citrate (pro-3S)-lyase] ligase [Candidatus Phytoplasma luffae]|uniref:[citrate (Pro-3S)-lyase] ligase n=1 Tax=Loofah witches'-broom phytoplasma TaxID=35773 RepID=A0A975FHY3_LOWBP|nr:adenylyltransferase/cytidyltransferase family protein [Candidatus Phytoplasma luffae]QTX02685.1 [citrate (pro-3S)-lyase] ligase [Candidatus Phytoplasma luffae]
MLFQKPKIIYPKDNKNKEIFIKIKKILYEEKFQKDIIDEYAIILSNENEIIGVIGRYLNNLRCLVIQPKYRNYNFANILIDFMIKRIYKNNFKEVFVFTKSINCKIFKNLGFKIIYSNDEFSFLTNRYDIFTQYLEYLKQEKEENNNNSAIVMNANPLTKGHEHLIKTASQNSDFVYIIMVSEEGSLFTYKERLDMVKLVTQNYNNIKVVEGSNYLVSKNVFPSYFLSSKEEVIKKQIILDSFIFVTHIASVLNIKKRFVGEEPFSFTTNLYNQIMKDIFQKQGIELVILPRLRYKDKAISATQARKLFINSKFEQIAEIVPISSLNYLKNLNPEKYKENKKLLSLVDKNN